MKKDNRFVNSYIKEDGSRISQYDLLKSVADSEEKKEFDDIELKSLHKKIIRFTDNGFIQNTDYGPAIVKSSFQDAHKNNRELRKEVKKILKTDSETNKFFKAKSIDKYLEFKNKKQKIFETPLDNVQKPKIVPTPSTFNVQSVNPGVPEGIKNLTKVSKPELNLEKYIEEKAKASLFREDEELRKKYGNTGLGALGSWNKPYGDDE